MLNYVFTPEFPRNHVICCVDGETPIGDVTVGEVRILPNRSQTAIISDINLDGSIIDAYMGLVPEGAHERLAEQKRAESNASMSKPPMQRQESLAQHFVDANGSTSSITVHVPNRKRKSTVSVKDKVVNLVDDIDDRDGNKENIEPKMM